MRRLVTDTLIIAERNLIRLPRRPELLLAFTDEFEATALTQARCEQRRVLLHRVHEEAVPLPAQVDEVEVLAHDLVAGT